MLYYWLAFLFVPVSLYMSDSNQTNILSIFMLITWRIGSHMNIKSKYTFKSDQLENPQTLMLPTIRIYDEDESLKSLLATFLNIL